MKLSIDMSNVSEGFELLPEGDYICKVTGVSKEPGTKAPYLKWELTVGTGPEKGKKISNITTLSPKALFALRDFLIACGLSVPKSAITLDTAEVVGKIVGITVTHGTYMKDGVEKPNANITELFRVAKGANGWGRVGNTPAKATKPEPEEDEDDIPFDGGTTVEADEIEEIEI